MLLTIAYLLLAEVTICSQNLQRPEPADNEKVEILVDRMTQANCNIIALQEVTGKNERDARKTLEGFTNKLGKDYRAINSGSNDRFIRNGLIIDTRQVELLRSTSYESYMLPQVDPSRGNSRFSRGPMFSLLRVKKTANNILLVNLHFKSKYKGWRDPYKLDYELLRMEMASGVNTLIDKELKRSPKNSLLVIAGDRNADRNDAANLILTGQLELSDFIFPASCKVNKNYKATCEKKKAKYVSLIDIALSEEEPYKRLWGSYRRKRKSYLLDDILVPASSAYVFKSGGFKGIFRKGSDHLLVWSRIKY